MMNDEVVAGLNRTLYFDDHKSTFANHQSIPVHRRSWGLRIGRRITVAIDSPQCVSLGCCTEPGLTPNGTRVVLNVAFLCALRSSALQFAEDGKNNAEDWRAQRNKRLGKDRQESAAMNEAMNELASIQATFAQKMSPIPRSHLGFP